MDEKRIKQQHIIQINVSPVELIQREDVATILYALDRYDVAMTRSKHLAVNIAGQQRSASVLQSVIPQHAHQHLV